MLLIGSGLRLIYISQQGQRQIQGRSVSQSGRQLVHRKNRRRRYNSPATATSRSVVVIVRRRFYCIPVSMSSPASFQNAKSLVIYRFALLSASWSVLLRNFQLSPPTCKIRLVSGCWFISLDEGRSEPAPDILFHSTSGHVSPISSPNRLCNRYGIIAWLNACSELGHTWIPFFQKPSYLGNKKNTTEHLVLPFFPFVP